MDRTVLVDGSDMLIHAVGARQKHTAWRAIALLSGVRIGIAESPLRVRILGPAHTPIDIRSAGTRQVVAAIRRHGVRKLVVQSAFGVAETRLRLDLVNKLFFRLVAHAVDDATLLGRPVTVSGPRESRDLAPAR